MCHPISSCSVQPAITEVTRKRIVFARFYSPVFRGVNKTFATPESLPQDITGIPPVGAHECMSCHGGDKTIEEILFGLHHA